jgi:hypothetical protein
MDEHTWTYWLHLPGCVLEGGNQRRWGGGTLHALEHDAWHALDQTVFQPTDYNDCRPVFYRGEVRGGQEMFGPARTVFDHIVALRGRLHRALALVSTWPLPPDPAQSCGYVMSERHERCQVFLIGPCGRDWVLTGHFRQPRQSLDETMLREAEQILELLQSQHDSLPGSRLESALQTLTLVSLPDAYVGDGGPPRWNLVFLSVVAALEPLLLGDIDADQLQGQSITAAFGVRMGALLADDFSRIADVASIGRSIYKLRSDLMHGRRGQNLKDAVHMETLVQGLAVFQASLRMVLLLTARQDAAADLPRLLSEAASDPNRFAALR